MSNEQRPCDVIAFDLDGTLVDTTALHVAATQAASQAVFALPVAHELVQRSLGLPLLESLGIVSAGRGHIRELAQAFMRYYAVHEHDGARCFADVLASLGTLRAGGLRLALLSNKLRQWGNEEIGRLGLARVFETLVFLEDMPKPKPSGWALQPILQSLQVEATRVLVVGDSVGDIACAQAAGAQSGAALWGARDPAALRDMHPTYCLADMAALLTLMGL